MKSEARTLEPQAQDLSQEKNFQFDALARQIPVVLITMNKDLNIKWANKSFREILGYSPEEIRRFSNGLASVLSPEERQGYSSWLKGVISGRKPLNTKRRLRIIHKNGSVIYCLFKPYFMSFQDNVHMEKLLHLMIIDETDRVLLDRCAIKDEKLQNLGAMAAEMAHEIKNTIIAIGGFAKRLRKIMPGSREIQIIESESTRLERLVKSINAYVRPGHARVTSQPVREILDQSLQLMAPELKTHRIRVDLRLQDMPEDWRSDRDALSEVFVNLIRNAVEALGTGGLLIIRSCISEDSACLEFENKMEKKSVVDSQTLFRAIEEGGSSIGLPLSFRIIKNLGGRLSFRKRGDSAVFRIELPRI